MGLCAQSHRQIGPPVSADTAVPSINFTNGFLCFLFLSYVLRSNYCVFVELKRDRCPAKTKAEIL